MRHAPVLYKLLALALVVAAAAYVISMATRSPPAEAGGAREPVAGPAAAAGRTAGSAVPTTTGEHELTAQPASAPRDANDLANYVAPGEAPRMAEVIQRLHDAGVHTGLGAFSPPGTSPPLIGIAVPEDYALPPGYVRHFQATDDGQRIEPILMYSPDYEFFDGNGQRIEIPPDRVVPPELAPPGLPLRPIQIPPPIDPRDISN